MRFENAAFFIMAIAASAWLLGCEALGQERNQPVEIINAPRSVVVGIPDLDLALRQSPDLKAAVEFRNQQGAVIGRYWIDYSLPATGERVVFAKRPDLEYAQVEIKLIAGDDVMTITREMPPISESLARVPLLEEAAHLEPGTAFDENAAPSIRLPDFGKIETIEPGEAPRAIDMEEIRRRVTADYNFPIAGDRTFVLPRSGSDDPDEWSIYFALNNDIYDPETGEHDSPFKYMVELPIDNDWLQAEGDESVMVDWRDIRLFMTREQVGGERLTGERKGLLGQTSESFTVDDEGNIYFGMLYRGPIRFNTREGKWEAPPVEIYNFVRPYLPDIDDLPYEDGVVNEVRADFANHIHYYNGRVYVALRRYAIFGTSLFNAAIVSIPVDHWDDAEAFRNEIRFNASSAPATEWALWDSHVGRDDKRRALRRMVAHDNRIYIPSYHANYFWVMDIAGDGSTEALAMLPDLDGRPIEHYEPQMHWVYRDNDFIGLTVEVRLEGETKLRDAFLPDGAFEFTEGVPDGAALASAFKAPRGFLYNPSRYGLVATSKHSLAIRIGAALNHDGGDLNIYYDSVSKMLNEPGDFADIVEMMSASSMGPEYHITPTPGDRMEALGNADYPIYNFARYDLSPDAETVERDFLNRKIDGLDIRLSLPARLGPYCHLWIHEDGDDVLYYAGYTGIARLRYRVGGIVPDRHQVEMLNHREHISLDGAPESFIQWFRHMLPGLGERVFITGVSQTARRGTAYSGGLMFFDRKSPHEPLSKISGMSRSYNTTGLAGRLVILPDGGSAQDITLMGNYSASDAETLPLDKRPAVTQPRVFLYREDSEGVHDRFGFTLRSADKARTTLRDITFAPNPLYLLILMGDGTLATFDIDAMRFADAIRLPHPTARFAHGRREASFLNLPDGGVMLGLIETERDEDPTSGMFIRIDVDASGQIDITPHLRCEFRSANELEVPVAFIYDSEKDDGSYDAVFGPNARTPEGAVRIIRGFLPARR